MKSKPMTVGELREQLSHIPHWLPLDIQVAAVSARITDVIFHPNRSVTIEGEEYGAIGDSWIAHEIIERIGPGLPGTTFPSGPSWEWNDYMFDVVRDATNGDETLGEAVFALLVQEREKGLRAEHK